jgi:nitrate/nitrite transporter NarK
MKEILFIVGFFVWYVLAVIIAEITGKNRRLSTEWAFFISFMLSPVAGVITYFLSEKKTG